MGTQTLGAGALGMGIGDMVNKSFNNRPRVDALPYTGMLQRAYEAQLNRDVVDRRTKEYQKLEETQQNAINDRYKQGLIENARQFGERQKLAQDKERWDRGVDVAKITLGKDKLDELKARNEFYMGLSSDKLKFAKENADKKYANAYDKAIAGVNSSFVKTFKKDVPKLMEYEIDEIRKSENPISTYQKIVYGLGGKIPEKALEEARREFIEATKSGDPKRIQAATDALAVLNRPLLSLQEEKPVSATTQALIDALK